MQRISYRKLLLVLTRNRKSHTKLEYGCTHGPSGLGHAFCFYLTTPPGTPCQRSSCLLQSMRNSKCARRTPGFYFVLEARVPNMATAASRRPICRKRCFIQLPVCASKSLHGHRADLTLQILQYTEVAQERSTIEQVVLIAKDIGSDKGELSVSSESLKYF